MTPQTLTAESGPGIAARPARELSRSVRVTLGVRGAGALRRRSGFSTEGGEWWPRLRPAWIARGDRAARPCAPGESACAERRAGQKAPGRRNGPGHTRAENDAGASHPCSETVPRARRTKSAPAWPGARLLARGAHRSSLVLVTVLAFARGGPTTGCASWRAPKSREAPVSAAPEGAGRPSRYCELLGHNAQSAFRERRRRAEAGEVDERADAGAGGDRPVSLAGASRLTGDLERTRDALATLGDSEALEAELAAVRADTQAEVSHSAQLEASARRERMLGRRRRRGRAGRRGGSAGAGRRNRG